MTHDEDTITAISTALGEGGIGIVRLSGQETLPILQKLFVGMGQKDLRMAPSHTLHYGHLAHPETGDILDEVLVSIMRSPHSYTREDVAEINSHGGMLALQKILEAALLCGARLATPGEFTKRAFLNGRIDLSQAESVIDIIRAKTNAGLQLAVQQLQGKLSTQVAELRAALTQLLASIEASIDFADEEIELISHEQISADLRDSLAHVDRLLAGAQEGKVMRDGLSVAIVGKPNVGKSSLLNVFLEEERAIVTPIPGTTRDTIEDYINLQGIPLRLIDTAGIRSTTDQIEQLGVERSRTMIAEADMALCLFDASLPWSQEDDDILDVIKGKNMLLALNKIDLPSHISASDLRAKVAESAPVFEISAREHQGVDELKQAIVADVMATPLESVAVTNVRHKQSLSLARNSLIHARESTMAQMSQEFIALDLRDALHCLGEITGETTTEDLLDVIFSTFCIGK